MFTLLKCIRQDTAWALFWVCVCVCVLYFNQKIFYKQLGSFLVEKTHLLFPLHQS